MNSSPHPSIILLPFGEWPYGDPAPSAVAGQDQLELRCFAKPPSVQGCDKVVDPDRGSVLGTDSMSCSMRAPASTSDDLEGSDMSKEMKSALQESSVLARARMPRDEARNKGMSKCQRVCHPPSSPRALSALWFAIMGSRFLP